MEASSICNLPLAVAASFFGCESCEETQGTGISASTHWKDVPEPVWNYTLGGYQVLKKWLSYRESALLGRPLTSDEAQSFTHHVRRITAILSLHDALDAHYGASV